MSVKKWIDLSAKILLWDVGSWLSINGEAIYKTKPWNYQNDTLNNNFWYKNTTFCTRVFHSDVMIHVAMFLSSRYTHRPDTGAVYGALTLKYQSKVMLGNIKLGSGSKVSLLGYDGDVSWKTYPNSTIEISMPPLPLDTQLRWAWVFKFENLIPSQQEDIML